jgi:hypothetical protein
MDPAATWRDALECLAENDLAGFMDNISNLREWRAKGGFAPAIGQGDANHFDALLSYLARSVQRMIR